MTVEGDGNSIYSFSFTMPANNVDDLAIVLSNIPAYTVKVDDVMEQLVAVDTVIPITFTVNDSSGEPDTSFNGAKNVHISPLAAAADGTYGKFEGQPLTAVNSAVSIMFREGVANASLILNAVNAYELKFQVEGVINGNAVGDIKITTIPGRVSQLEIVTLPVPGMRASDTNVPLASQPKIELRDAFKNICTDDSTSVVTVSVDNATLGGTNTAVASNGYAEFSNLDLASSQDVDVIFTFTLGWISVSTEPLRFTSDSLYNVDVTEMTTSDRSTAVYGYDHTMYTRTFRVTNTGNTELTDLNVNLSPETNFEISIDTLSQTLLPGESFMFHVTPNENLTVSSSPYSTTLNVSATEISEDSIPISFNVNPKPLTESPVSVYLDYSDFPYNGYEHTANVVAYNDGILLSNTVDYTVSGNTATNAGTYTVTVNGVGNYTGTVYLEYTIYKAYIDKPVTECNYAINGGGKLTATLTLKNGISLKSGVGYTYSGGSNNQYVVTTTDMATFAWKDGISLQYDSNHYGETSYLLDYFYIPTLTTDYESPVKLWFSVGETHTLSTTTATLYTSTGTPVTDEVVDYDSQAEDEPQLTITSGSIKANTSYYLIIEDNYVWDTTNYTYTYVLAFKTLLNTTENVYYSTADDIEVGLMFSGGVTWDNTNKIFVVRSGLSVFTFYEDEILMLAVKTGSGWFIGECVLLPYPGDKISIDEITSSGNSTVVLSSEWGFAVHKDVTAIKFTCTVPYTNPLVVKAAAVKVPNEDEDGDHWLVGDFVEYTAVGTVTVDEQNAPFVAYIPEFGGFAVDPENGISFSFSVNGTKMTAEYDDWTDKWEIKISTP